MYRRILVPVDGSRVSMEGLGEAIRIAKTTGARLRVLHVVDGVAFVHEHNVLLADAENYRESGRKLVARVKGLLERQQVTVDVVMVEDLGGRAAESIVREAKMWPADLILMGTHGRRGVSRLVLGSDAEIVLRLASVPVLLGRSFKSGAQSRRSGKIARGKEGSEQKRRTA